MKYRRYVAFMAVIALIAVCFAGCSKDNGEGGTTAPEAGTSQTASTGNAGNTSDQTADAGKQTNDSAQPDVSKDTAAPDEGSVSDGEKAPADDGAEDDAEPYFTVITDVKDGYTLNFDNGELICTITRGGEYSVMGSADEGRIIINAPDNEVVVILKGVTLSSSKDSVIYVEAAEEVTVKAADGSNNVLSDMRAKKTGDKDTTGNGCIYSEDDLKIQGKGKLVINASYNNGIHCKNDIKIKNLTLEVNAVNDGIRGNDSITVESGTITVVAGGDGLQTKNTDVSAKGKQRGIISITGGTVNITADKDCFDAAYELQIADEAVVSENK